MISKFLQHYLEKEKCGSRKVPKTRIGLFLGCTGTLMVLSIVSKKQNNGQNMVTVKAN